MFIQKIIKYDYDIKNIRSRSSKSNDSKACLSDVSANSEKINPLVQKIYPTYNSVTLKKGPGHQQ